MMDFVSWDDNRNPINSWEKAQNSWQPVTTHQQLIQAMDDLVTWALNNGDSWGPFMTLKNAPARIPMDPLLKRT